MWVVIHMCMEATLGISLYSYLYLKLAKMLCLSYYLLCFSSTKLENRAEQVLPESKGEGESVRERGQSRGRGVEVTQTMYTHMNKCKNNKKVFNFLPLPYPSCE
jgi:hypothetical protein